MLIPDEANRDKNEDIAFQHVQNYHYLNLKNENVNFIPFFIHENMANSFKNIPAENIPSDDFFIFNFFRLRILDHKKYHDVKWALFFRLGINVGSPTVKNIGGCQHLSTSATSVTNIHAFLLQLIPY